MNNNARCIPVLKIIEYFPTKIDVGLKIFRTKCPNKYFKVITAVQLEVLFLNFSKSMTCTKIKLFETSLALLQNM